MTAIKQEKITLRNKQQIISKWQEICHKQSFDYRKKLKTSIWICCKTHVTKILCQQHLMASSLSFQYPSVEPTQHDDRSV